MDTLYSARILVVEDDRELTGMLRLYLEKRGLKVESANSGEEALRHALEFLPHVILLDVALPDIDGFEVCSRLRHQPRTSHIPVLFLTSRTQRSDRLAGLSLGADDYIIKPFDVSELYLRIRNAVLHATRENTTDPLTGLPTGGVVRAQVAVAIPHPQLALLRIALQHAEAFRDVYGPLAFGDIRVYLARLIAGAVNTIGTPQDFLGVVDPDTFVVIGSPERVNAIGQRVVDIFNPTAGKHYNETDCRNGYVMVGETRVPIMQLSYQVFSTQAAKAEFFSHA